MLFANKATSSSLFSVGPSATPTWANTFNKPSPASTSSIGLWSAPPRTLNNPPKLNLFKTQNPNQSSNQSLLSINTMGSNNNGNIQAIQPEGPGTPTFGPLKGSSKGLMPFSFQQDQKTSPNLLFSDFKTSSKPSSSLIEDSSRNGTKITLLSKPPQAQENRLFTQANTKHSSVFWQLNQPLPSNNKSPSTSIFNISNQQPKENQARAVSPSRPATVNNKIGLPFSWTSPSRPAANFLFKPKKKPVDNSRQAIPQQNYNNTQEENEIEFFKRLEARVSHKDYKDSTFMQGEELPYNIFEESGSNYRRFNENMKRYYPSHRTRGNYMEDEQFDSENIRTRKELTALNYSRDLVRMLKSQETNMEFSDKLEIETDMIVYVLFLDGDYTERTIAIDVSSGSTCLELKKAVLGMIFGNQDVNLDSFKLHRNRELLEENKSLCEQSINSLDYLVLEKVGN